MALKLDLHIHSRHSPDCKSGCADIAAAAAAAGLMFYAVTDHDALPELSDPAAIRGEEISTVCGHVIGLFLTDKITETNTVAALKAVKEQGGVTVIPHPLRPGSGLCEEEIRTLAPLIDAIEISNPSNTEYGNARAYALAAELGKTMLCGSDAHRTADIGRGAFTVGADLPDAQTLKSLLLENRLEPRFSKQQLPPTAAQPLRLALLWSEHCVRTLGLHRAGILRYPLHLASELGRRLTGK